MTADQPRQIGVFFGTMAPLHIGHQAEIYKAAALNDRVVVVASGYTGDRGDQIGLPVTKRFRYLREAFADEPNIKIAHIVEDDIPKMPDGWHEWTKALLAVVNQYARPEDHVTFYTGEPSYQTELEARLAPLGNYTVSLMDRTVLQISATAIRQDPLAHWDAINRVFRRHFTKKVLVLGGPQTGKSTLVRRLARTYSAPFSLDYRQTYREQSNVHDNELGARDFLRLIQGQYDANSREINSPANNGITFFDTNPWVTQVLAEQQLPATAYHQVASALQALLAEEQLDGILMIPPHAGLQGAALTTAGAWHERLMGLIHAAGYAPLCVTLPVAGAAGDAAGYYARYMAALRAVDAIKN